MFATLLIIVMLVVPIRVMQPDMFYLKTKPSIAYRNLQVDALILWIIAFGKQGISIVHFFILNHFIAHIILV